MEKLKNAYSIKEKFVNINISELKDILKKYSVIDNIDVNPDNTLYLESNSGIDSMLPAIDDAVSQWIGDAIISMETAISIGMVYNSLPLTNNTCILRI